MSLELRWLLKALSRPDSAAFLRSQAALVAHRLATLATGHPPAPTQRDPSGRTCPRILDGIAQDIYLLPVLLDPVDSTR